MRTLPFTALLPDQYVSSWEEGTIFYDIETTGLSKERQLIYLIGAFTLEGNALHGLQWLSEEPKEERLLLAAFSNYLSPATQTVQFNGDAFDAPFLAARYALYGMTSPLEALPSRDLFRELKPLKRLLGLPNLKQPTLESFLGLPLRQYPDGAKNTALIRSCWKNPDPAREAPLLGHNKEDLVGLAAVGSLLAYFSLLEGGFSVEDLRYERQRLSAALRLDVPLPKAIVREGEDYTLRANGRSVTLVLREEVRGFRYYYPNIRDYEYVLSEEMAMPKSITRFLDKSLKKPATRETCYTWFRATEDFLIKKERQHTFLSRLLAVII